LPEVSRRPGDQRAARPRPGPVSECGALGGPIRGASTDLSPADGSL
jgi:hypothetical protein